MDLGAGKSVVAIIAVNFSPNGLRGLARAAHASFAVVNPKQRSRNAKAVCG